MLRARCSSSTPRAADGRLPRSTRLPDRPAAEAPTVRAWVVDTPGPVDTGPLRRIERDLPEPGPGQVRVRVLCCGVCRTDLHLAEGDLPRAGRRSRPDTRSSESSTPSGPGRPGSREGSGSVWPGSGTPTAAADTV